MNSTANTTASVAPGSPGYVPAQEYRPIVDKQLALIEAYLAAHKAKVS